MAQDKWMQRTSITARQNFFIKLHKVYRYREETQTTQYNTQESQPLYKDFYMKSIESLIIDRFSVQNHVSHFTVCRMFQCETVAVAQCKGLSSYIRCSDKCSPAYVAEWGWGGYLFALHFLLKQIAQPVVFIKVNIDFSEEC